MSIKRETNSNGLGLVGRERPPFLNALISKICCKKKQTLQCNGLTSKHSNSFVIVFIV